MPLTGQVVVAVAVVAPGLGLFEYLWPPAENPLSETPRLKSGDWLVVPLSRRVLLGLVVHVTELTEEAAARSPYQRRAALGVFPHIPSLHAGQVQFFEFMAAYYRASLGAVLSMAVPAWIRSLKNLQSVYALNEPSQASPLEKLLGRLDDSLSEGHSVENSVPLTKDQTEAVEQAALALALSDRAEAPPIPVYLHGVTGSGKTMVYTALIKHLWQQRPHAQVLYLVPEIALTPVLKTRLLRDLGLEPRDLCVLHSAMTDRQRALAWLRAVRGHVRLILGTRLSLLTPLAGLAMIVVDEEHDSSYKSQDTVRYSARDLAAYMAANQNIRLILGSATPSLESLAQIEKGRYRLVRLLKQATGAPRAEITLIDLNKERVTVAGSLTESVHAAIQQTLGRGRQVLVFLNRRGYAPLLSCPSCGWVQGCEHCSVSTVLHKKTGRWQMVCHHCGIVSRPHQRCPSCGSAELGGLGLGIQWLEERLSKAFPDVPVLRVDSDSAGSPEKMATTLEGLQQPKAEIILATQILAKGHDLPGLSTVVVLDVDAQLLSPEFRAPEWLFSTLLQVSGRAGRHEDQARVFLQTRYPSHPLFQGLRAEDPSAYLTGLLKERRQAGLPPYGYIAALRMSARTEASLQAQFTKLYEELSVNHSGDCQVHRPCPSYPEKRANHYRWHMVVESSRRGPLNATLDLAMGFAQAHKMRDLIIDIDPLGLS